MDVAETLRTIYTTTIVQDDGSYHITVPEREIATGTVAENETYRVALISTGTPNGDTTERTDATRSGDHDNHQQEHDGPPVVEGEQRNVEIENLGDQGDGIAKVEHGYVVIVPETEIGDRVTVEMQQVRENVAFADVVEYTPRDDV